MLPDPLHPALVHFPIVLAILAPLVALAVLLALRARAVDRRAWLVVVVLHAAISASGWITAEAGEDEEERVERVVDEDFIEEHEEAAEWFLWIAGATLPIAAIGLLDGRVAAGARVLTIVGGLVAAVAVARVGHTGGELVYEHGAASAYAKGEAAAHALEQAGRSARDSDGEPASPSPDDDDDEAGETHP